MRTVPFLIAAAVVALSGGGGPVLGAILPLEPTDFVAMRILEPPADCADFSPQVQPCGAGPAHVAGVSNAGDMFGVLQTNHPHLHHNEEAIRWLRSTGYTPENVRRPDMAPGFIPTLGQSPLIRGRANGIHMDWVTSGGFATGRGHVDNTDGMIYDIVNDEWFYLGQGDGQKGNNLGQMVIDHWNRIGQPPRIADISLLEDPLSQGNLESTVHSFPFTVLPRAINDSGVVVGSTVNGDPFKVEPLPGVKGENGLPVWGEPVVMEELGPFGSGEATDLSHAGPPFAIGTSVAITGVPGIHGIVWNVADGTIVADLGPMRASVGCGTQTCGFRINGEGTIIIGQRTQLAFPPTFEEMIWWSSDGWETVNTLTMDEVLKVVPGGQHWARITALTGVNDAGQITGQGLLHDIVNAQTGTLLTAWPHRLAVSEDCVGNKGVFFHPNNGCGIPFLLDTLPLADGVVKGDVNNDGIVNFLDITPFINAQAAEGDEGAFLLLTPDGCVLCADIDMDGAIDFIDITPFVNLLDQLGATAVPEPASALLLLLGMALSMRRRFS